LFDMGPYYLSTPVHLLGPVSGVVARASTATASRRIGSGPRAGEHVPVEVPTHVGALIDFQRGARALSTFSFQASRPRVGVVEITGTDGTLVLPDPNTFDGTVRVWRGGMTGDADAEVHPAVGSTFSRGAGIVELARAIRARRVERASGELAYHVLDVMVSIAESAEHGERVPVVSTTHVPPPLPETWDPIASTL
jgi:predicted dehydrogenase